MQETLRRRLYRMPVFFHQKHYLSHTGAGAIPAISLEHVDACITSKTPDSRERTPHGNKTIRKHAETIPNFTTGGCTQGQRTGVAYRGCQVLRCAWGRECRTPPPRCRCRTWAGGAARHSFLCFLCFFVFFLREPLLVVFVSNDGRSTRGGHTVRRSSVPSRPIPFQVSRVQHKEGESVPRRREGISKGGDSRSKKGEGERTCCGGYIARSSLRVSSDPWQCVVHNRKCS